MKMKNYRFGGRVGWLCFRFSFHGIVIPPSVTGIHFTNTTNFHLIHNNKKQPKTLQQSVSYICY